MKILKEALKKIINNNKKKKFMEWKLKKNLIINKANKKTSKATQMRKIDGS